MQNQAKNLRFADYFFRAGIDPKCDLIKSKLPDLNLDNQLKDVEFGPSLEEKSPNSRSNHPLTFRYEADTIYRYPSKDYGEDDRYPPYTPMVFALIKIRQ